MKKPSTLLTFTAGIVALAAVVSIAFAVSANTADTNQSEKGSWGSRFGFMHELSEEARAEMESRRQERENQHEAVMAAIENNSYEAFAAAIDEDYPMHGKINADNFADFVHAHELIDEGKEILEGLGVGRGMGGAGRGPGIGMHR